MKLSQNKPILHADLSQDNVLSDCKKSAKHLVQEGTFRDLSVHSLLFPCATPIANSFFQIIRFPRKYSKFIRHLASTYPNFNWPLDTTTVINQPLASAAALESHTAATVRKNFIYRVPTRQDLYLSICFCQHSFLCKGNSHLNAGVCCLKVIDRLMVTYSYA